MIIGIMRGSTVIKILIAFVFLALGWTLGQVCENISPFTLDWSISLSDILSILVEIILAVVLALLIEKGMQNQRVEKDFYISELNEAQQTFSDLEKTCARSTHLSFQLTVFQIEKIRKDLIKMWDIMKERKKHFHDNNDNIYNDLVKSIKTLNSQLSDSSYYKNMEGFKPIKISRGIIYLNNTVSSDIDKTFGAIKNLIFKMKIGINNM